MIVSYHQGISMCRWYCISRVNSHNGLYTGSASVKALSHREICARDVSSRRANVFMDKAHIAKQSLIITIPVSAIRISESRNGADLSSE